MKVHLVFNILDFILFYTLSAIFIIVYLTDFFNNTISNLDICILSGSFTYLIDNYLLKACESNHSEPFYLVKFH